jgi:hypothetical protein
MKPQVPEGHRVRYTHVRCEDEAGNVLPRGGQTLEVTWLCRKHHKLAHTKGG